MTGRVQDKSALVTGAGSGIGRATAVALAAEGARVVVADVDMAGGEETCALVRAAGGEALAVRGWMRAGMRALDLGAGTGAMALGLAQRGVAVTAIDRAPELIAVLQRRAAEISVAVSARVGVAEDTGEPAGRYDLVTAAQCWWWFDAARVLREARRVLVPGGRVLIVGFSYLALPGSLAQETEALVLRHNPGWLAANSPGIFPEQAFQLATHGFGQVETFSYDVEVPFTHESWRGRMRACNGVAASLSVDEVAAFDSALAALLTTKYAAELSVSHRVFVATGIG